MPQNNLVRNKQKRRATKKLAQWREKQEAAATQDQQTKKPAKAAK